MNAQVFASRTLHSAAHSQPHPSAPPSLPLAVQVGFAGARRLWPEGAVVDPVAFERALAQQLRAALQQLPQALGLNTQHFLVGLSQIAAGADLLFTQAAADLGWGQRIFLPQLREDYLGAQGSRGPDFTPAEQTTARALLALPHIIEERVVTTAADRATRFDDTNLHILAEADVLVCLRREGQVGQLGGTQHLMDRALARGLKVLDLCVSITPEGQPALAQSWEALAFNPPTLPAAVQSAAPVLRTENGSWPDVRTYAQALKAAASERAGQRRSGFERATLIIVGTHVLATLLATLVMDVLETGLVGKVVLVVELFVLAWGFVRHWKLHRDKHTEDWAMARLCAELARSALALGRLPGSLAHFLTLPVPSELRPLLRTLNILQLRQICQDPVNDWAAERVRYVTERLDSPEKGQLPYYAREQLKAERLVRRATWAFTTLSALAFGATLAKLVLKTNDVQGWSIDVTGLAAVVFPVMAVGGMSLAAALDAEARAHIFHHMQDFLRASKQRIEHALSPREVASLAAETEARLFGETVMWYSRRAYTSVA
jgi:hypothetical protein